MVSYNTPFILPSQLLRASSYMNFFRIQCDFILYKKKHRHFFFFIFSFIFILFHCFYLNFFYYSHFFFRVPGNVISFYINKHTIFFHFSLYFISFFFCILIFYYHLFRVPGCSGMFRDIPGCSGMFHVPGFIDGGKLFYRGHKTCTFFNAIFHKKDFWKKGNRFCRDISIQ